MDTNIQNQFSQNASNNTTYSNENSAPITQPSTTGQPSAIHNSSQLPDVDRTAMREYFELVQSEYSIERGKKESFENRAGIIMALIGVLLVFILDKLPLDEVLKLCKDQLTFVLLIRIILGFSTYITLIAALFFSFLTITTSKQENYPIDSINLSYLAENRKDALARITLKYRDIILNHRKHNEKRAHKFKISLVLSIISICCFIIFFVIK